MNSSFALRSVFALCLGAAALTFASCSDDDETTGGNPPTPGQTDPDSPAATANPVTGMASQWGEAAVYRYDAEGRLVSGTDLEGNAFRFTFSPMGLSLDDGDGYTEKWSGIRLNADGTLASGSAAFEDSYEGDTDRGSGNIACTYNADGRLASASLTTRDDEGAATDVYTFEYDGDNLVKMTNVYREEGYEYNESYEFAYAADSLRLNTSGVYLMAEALMYDFLWYGGYFGRPTANIPVSVTESYNETGGTPYSSTKDIDVEYDSEGNIARLTSLYSGELSFTYAAAPDTASKVAPLSAPKPAKRRAHLFGRMAR